MADNYVDIFQRLQRFAMYGQQRIPRVLKDRAKPLESLSGVEVRERYRFYPETIVMIVGVVFNELDAATRRSLRLPPLLSVLVTLQFFATGAHHLLIAEIHGISRPSVGRAIDRITNALCRHINKFISMPVNDAERRIEKKEFYSIAGFPNVLGCIDLTHVRIRAPTHNEADFVNRKGFHSVNIQMVCDARLIIMDVVAKWPGSVQDSRLFRESRLFGVLENGMDGVLLGDSGYACKKYLMTPYLNPQTSGTGEVLPVIFNRSLCKTRVIIEQTFGVLKGRFAVMSYGIRTSEMKTCRTTMACAILHNIGIKPGDSFGRFVVESDNHPDAPNQPVDVAGNAFRDFVSTTYFS
ncbi:putative nuclease HARBI1 [Mya arenaria]|uniref:putative nuclease HARBI1 n=1 Tax=Mya arenaria TaxID=6604 RepID=UPI0022DEE6B5|nr:putative nuclease HARBI1 [Mya arenaria]